MPANIKIARQATGVREEWPRDRGRFAIRSRFVLLALALLGLHVYGTDLNVRVSLQAEAAFTTVIRHEPIVLPTHWQHGTVDDEAGVFMTICQCHFDAA